jgi:3-hydroxyacyl-CoA dehydrogenase
MAKEGNLGLKNGKGFCGYDADAANRVQGERDMKLCDRLKLFQKENAKK